MECRLDRVKCNRINLLSRENPTRIQQSHAFANRVALHVGCCDRLGALDNRALGGARDMEQRSVVLSAPTANESSCSLKASVTNQQS